MTRRAACLLLAALSPAVGARAQTFEPAGPLGQITHPASPADDARSSQIGAATRDVSTPRATPPGAQSPAQLAAPRDAAPPAQLVHEPRTASGPAQLSTGPRSAQPPTPLSRPADGRTAATTRIEGRDRCDPAAAARPAGKCAAVIETRGGDFPPPSAEPLSPEQRLLVEQRQLDQRAGEQPGARGDAIARTASRRIARDGADANAPDMQGLAAVVLGANATAAANAAAAAPKADDPVAGLTADQAAIATGILGGLTGAPR